jgi:DNA-binding transcriptional LysR family regulator
MIDIRKLDLNLLVVFQEIYQERQISGVAARLNLSQPAVSNALARLRKSLQDELFVRTNLGMQPTPLAERLAEPVCLALAQMQAALNVQQGFVPETSDRCFTIAMSDVGELYFMPLLIQHFAKLAPHVSLRTVRAGNINLKEELEVGRIDLALGAFEKISSSLYQRRLFRQPFVLMYRRGHALEGERVISTKRLLQAQHLIVACTESPYDRINQIIDAAGMTAQFRVPHFTAVPYIISTTDLVVTVPQKLAESAALPFGLAYAPSPQKLPMLQTNMFWHRRFNQDEASLWLRETMVRVFGESAEKAAAEAAFLPQ